MKAPVENGQRRNTENRCRARREAKARHEGNGWLLIGLFAWAAVLVPSALFGASPHQARGLHPQLTLTVIVYNYANVSAGGLRRAQREAARIIRSASVETTWIDCAAPGLPSFPGQRSQLQQCRDRRLVGAIVVLRILNGSAYNSASLAPEALGFSSGSDLASAFYDRVAGFAQLNGDQGDTPGILGDVIAHEIGHLLLGPHAHFPIGIMRGRWDSGQVRRAVQGALTFTSDESSKIRAVIEARMESRGPSETL